MEPLEEDKLYKAARKKVRMKRQFYSHLFMYIAVSTFLTFVNWFSSPGNWWVKWVWIGWGIGVFFNGLGLFRKNILFSDDWEERKIKEEIERMKTNKN
jgi:hypothetical protein